MTTARLDSPYVIGAGLGMLELLSFATAGRGLGVTSAFESTAAIAARRIAPDAANINDYVKQREEVPKIDWESFLVIGVVAGSFLASRWRRGSRPRPRRLSRRTSKGSRNAPLGAAFLGGALMMLGARMANGCTSGHTITGTMQLAVSSWIFSPLMFASAALVARAVAKRGRR